MSLSKYGEFLVFAIVLIVIPGPDFAVVVKNTLVGGRRRGNWTAAGVASSSFAQGTAAAFGLSAVIVRAQPVFQAVKWAGVGYLLFLGAQAIRAAVRGQYPPLDGQEPDAGSAALALAGWRQGFVGNITNPKVLVFYLAVLPQFLSPAAGLGWLLVFAWSHAILGMAYKLVLVTGLHAVKPVLMKRTVRRSMDAVTGTILIGFGARLATEHI